MTNGDETGGGLLWVRSAPDRATDQTFEVRTFPVGAEPDGAGWVAVQRRTDEEVIAMLTPLTAHALGCFLDIRQRGATEREVRDIDKLLRSTFATLFRTIVTQADTGARQIVDLEREARR
jgi:hypothetical protein